MPKRLLSLLASLALAGGLIAGVAATASAADVGDGLLSCNRGEICFARDIPSTTYQKHFWYSADHNGYYFTNVNTGNRDGGPLQDHADQVRNRDTVCAVLVVDNRGIFPDDSYRAPNDGVWKNIPSTVDNENDHHTRCA
jgi:hypothetical protein